MKLVVSCLCLLFLSSCAFKFEEADLVVHNATIYSMDGQSTTYQAMAIKDGKILELGPDREILNKYSYTEELDARKLSIYPGFIDAHCHFYGYGRYLSQCNLVGTTSFEEVLERVQAHDLQPHGEWIMGRGWDQNDWASQEFPNKEALDELFPSTPVILRRVDGHAALVNSEALRRAKIDSGGAVQGGMIEVIDGQLTGILIDNAMDLMDDVIPEPSAAEIEQALSYAENNCFAVGLTSITDAGLEKGIVDAIDAMHKAGSLKMQIYAMLTDNEENLAYWPDAGPYRTDRLNVRSFKFYADGALGSRGACLLQPYADVMPDHHGTILRTEAYYQEQAARMVEAGFQMNTHCIGDSANRLMLSIYQEALQGKVDHRWRIEHAQVIHPDDFARFSEISVVPSVQPTHCTSDMPWAQERVGDHRIEGAYAYKTLMQQNGWLPLGTDFPVEDISPIKTFYAAVFREMGDHGADVGGFLTDEALTREQAMRGMTIWAALSNFEENEKGSLEVGKQADFVWLDNDLLKASKERILETQVLGTWVQGENVYRQ